MLYNSILWKYRKLQTGQESNLISGSFKDVMIWAWCLLMISCTSVTNSILVMFSWKMDRLLFQYGKFTLAQLDVEARLPAKGINQVNISKKCNYQTEVPNVWLPDCNKLPKKSHTLWHHLLFSIQMHDLYGVLYMQTDLIKKTRYQAVILWKIT